MDLDENDRLTSFVSYKHHTHYHTLPVLLSSALPNLDYLHDVVLCNNNIH